MPDPSQPTSHTDSLARVLALVKPGWLYRGESKWFESGMPSFGRKLRPDAPDAIAAECSAIRAFQHRSHPFVSSNDLRLMDNMFGVLIIMQHYGWITRLLDWTSSAWVALYHLAGGDIESDGFLWAFDSRSFLQNVPETDWQAALGRMTNATDVEKYQAAAVACRTPCVGAVINPVIK